MNLILYKSVETKPLKTNRRFKAINVNKKCNVCNIFLLIHINY